MGQLNSMQPSEFLRIAEELSRKTGDEAALRTSVGRSYFALFNCVKQFIVEQNIRLPKTAKAHEDIYYFLNNCGIPQMVEVANDLNDLRDERNDADYDLAIDKFQSGNHAILLGKRAHYSHDSFVDYTSKKDNRKRVAKGIFAYQGKLSSSILPSAQANPEKPPGLDRGAS